MVTIQRTRTNVTENDRHSKKKEEEKKIITLSVLCLALKNKRFDALFKRLGQSKNYNVVQNGNLFP